MILGHVVQNIKLIKRSKESLAAQLMFSSFTGSKKGYPAHARIANMCCSLPFNCIFSIMETQTFFSEMHSNKKKSVAHK